MGSILEYLNFSIDEALETTRKKRQGLFKVKYRLCRGKVYRPYHGTEEGTFWVKEKIIKRHGTGYFFLVKITDI